MTQEQIRCMKRQQLSFQVAYRHMTMHWRVNMTEDSHTTLETLVSNAGAQYNANASLQMRCNCQTLRHNKQSSLHCAMHAI